MPGYLMKVLSLNIRGFRGLTKIKSLYSLLSATKPDMLFFLETMCDHTHSLLSFAKFRPGWEFCATDSLSLSRGLLTTWDPSVFCCKTFVSPSGILVKAVFRNQPLELSCLNCYGPYHNRTVFWEAIVNEGIFDHTNLIIAHDLNFTLSDVEIWGNFAHIDPLSPYFVQLLVRNNMVDTVSTCISPT